MKIIIILLYICEKFLCTHFSSNLISGFTENTTFSNGVFQQVITRRKKQQKYQSAMTEHRNGAGHYDEQ